MHCVNIKANPAGYKSLIETGDAVYIGRRNNQYGLQMSIWANPFVVGHHGNRIEVIEKYEEWVRTSPALCERLHELMGKILVCWCAPQSCHGDVLIKLIEEHENY